MNSFESTLRAVIDRIIPADADPGALELGSDRFVIGRLAEAEADSDLIIAGLAVIENRAMAEERAPFADLTDARRDALLESVADAPWFVRLVTLTSEGYYADPDNGGNEAAQSWAMIGYHPRLPEGRSGPPAFEKGRTSRP